MLCRRGLPFNQTGTLSAQPPAQKRIGNMAQVALRKIVKMFDRTPAVQGIDLDIADREFVVLVGPSGCGKTTTLRMIAGLEEATSGEIYIGDQLVNDVPPKDRDIAMVFQNYALYPHMTVFENMSFGLRLRRFPKAEIKERVEAAARILDITELLSRQPKQLSGGQRQRVAMGRAIVRNPKVFLFDEPLSNLDAKLRVQMRTEIKKVHQKVTTTTVYVTHDQVEAMTLADRVVIMNAGRIEQIGSPYEVYHHPKTRFVAGFIGSPAMNFLPCQLVANGSGLTVRLSERLSFAVPPERADRYRGQVGRELLFGLRPEDIIEKRGDLPPGRAAFDVLLDVVEPMGMETMVYFIVDGVEVCGRVNPAVAGNAGETMPLVADLNHMHLIDPRTDQVL
jgi:multiple sugar transport system ATP-binding protein